MIYKGKKFENQVADLLSLAGYNIRGEELIGSKKADLIIEEKTFGKNKTYAVECKNYTKQLSKNEVSHILAEYNDFITVIHDR